MKVVYYDYGGSHSSVLAAGIHSRKIDKTTIPLKEQIMALPYFDKTGSSDFGKLNYIGDDENGNQIYVLGTKQSRNNDILLRNLVDLMGTGDRLIFSNTMPYVNNLMRVGGWLSRVLAITSIGRLLVLYGTRNIFPQLINLVERTKIQMVNEATQ